MLQWFASLKKSQTELAEVLSRQRRFKHGKKQRKHFIASTTSALLSGFSVMDNVLVQMPRQCEVLPFYIIIIIIDILTYVKLFNKK